MNVRALSRISRLNKAHHRQRDERVMLPATRDIWQGHPSTQAWKLDQQSSDLVTELHHAAWLGNTDKITVSNASWLNSCKLRGGLFISRSASAGFVSSRQQRC